MEKLAMLYEGKAKKIHATDNPDIYWVEYKDDATAFNGLKKGSIADKGVLNNKISAVFFKMLAEKGIENHFVELINDREMLVKKVDILPVEVVVRNIAAGSLAKRIGLTEGTRLPHPIVELYYKDDALGDPLVNYYHLDVLKAATREQISQMEDAGLKINSILAEFMQARGITLVDFKLEFGLYQGKVILADEISPDTCRFWDAASGEKLDKDRFRQDLGKVEEAYQEILKRLTGE